MKSIFSLGSNQSYLASLIILSLSLFGSCTNPTKNFEAPLFNNLGNYWVEATTESEDANRFFVQGLLMSYGFNHAEAARSFREAIRLDSTFAMGYWGLGYVLGPNYNAGMSDEDKKEVLWVVDQAIKYSSDAMSWEKILIESIRVKFPKDGSDPQEVLFADFMNIRIREEAFDDPNMLAFLAESKMNLHAWDLYTLKGGDAKDWTPEIVELLEKAIEIEGEHPLANHLYIHATEASSKPEIGLDAADKLTRLVPGSAHLMHMPSHVYINTGDYHRGSEVNEIAVKVDSTYIAQCKVQGVYPQLYYPHNYHFLAACAALEGRGARSIEASMKMADIIDRNYLGKEGYGTVQHYITVPYNVLVKFAQWEKIMVLNSPDTTYKYPEAMWHYARGMALTNLNKPTSAQKELDELIKIIEKGSLDGIGIWDINSARQVGDIAKFVLSAELAQQEGNWKLAEEFYLNAIEIEDHLGYNEPPDWFFAVRHFLGDLYLKQGEFTLAEAVYRTDLNAFPKNGFSLNGLYHSLKGQNELEAAASVRAKFETAWQYADSELEYSRIHPEKRESLAIQIQYDSPNDLIYLAGTYCGLK